MAPRNIPSQIDHIEQARNNGDVREQMIDFQQIINHLINVRHRRIGPVRYLTTPILVQLPITHTPNGEAIGVEIPIVPGYEDIFEVAYILRLFVSNFLCLFIERWWRYWGYPGVSELQRIVIEIPAEDANNLLAREYLPLIRFTRANHVETIQMLMEQFPRTIVTINNLVVHNVGAVPPSPSILLSSDVEQRQPQQPHRVIRHRQLQMEQDVEQLQIAPPTPLRLQPQHNDDDDDDDDDDTVVEIATQQRFAMGLMPAIFADGDNDDVGDGHLHIHRQQQQHQQQPPHHHPLSSTSFHQYQNPTTTGEPLFGQP